MRKSDRKAPSFPYGSSGGLSFAKGEGFGLQCELLAIYELSGILKPLEKGVEFNPAFALVMGINRPVLYRVIELFHAAVDNGKGKAV